MLILPSKGSKGLLRLKRELRSLGAEARSVDIVCHERIADMRQMHTDLVGPAGLETAGKEARDRLAVDAGVSLQRLPMGDRFPSAFPDGPLVARMRVAVDRGIDGA